MNFKITQLTEQPTSKYPYHIRVTVDTLLIDGPEAYRPVITEISDWLTENNIRAITAGPSVYLDSFEIAELIVLKWD